jgi:hypothetical protein
MIILSSIFTMEVWSLVLIGTVLCLATALQPYRFEAGRRTTKATRGDRWSDLVGRHA